MIDRLLLIDRSRLLFWMDVCRGDIDLNDVFTFLPAASALHSARCAGTYQKAVPVRCGNLAVRGYLSPWFGRYSWSR